MSLAAVLPEGAEHRDGDQIQQSKQHSRRSCLITSTNKIPGPPR
jgi:hypothetical protein